MEIKNVVISTDYEYVKITDGDGDEIYNPTKKQDWLVLNIPLPGGQATYKIPITNEQRESIEYASKLAKKSD